MICRYKISQGKGCGESWNDIGVIESHFLIHGATEGCLALTNVNQ